MNICKTLAINKQHCLKRATELDKYLSLFFVEICKSEGSDYVLGDLEGLFYLYCFDGHQRPNESKISITKQEECQCEVQANPRGNAKTLSRLD